MKLDYNDFLIDFNEDELAVLNEILHSTVETQLSTGAKNALLSYLNGWVTLENLINHSIIPPRTSYRDIERVGAKANTELIELMNRINFTLHCIKDSVVKSEINQDTIRAMLANDKIQNDAIEERRQEIMTKLDSLSPDQTKAINYYIRLIIKQLTVRSYNALNALLNNEITIKSLIDHELLYPNYDYYTIPNVGEKSANEIEKFILHITFYLKKIAETHSTQEITEIKNKNVLLYFFPHSKSKSIHIDYNKSLILFVIHTALTNNLLFSKQDTFIFTNTHQLFHHSKRRDLSAIAQDLDLSRERVRQIRNEFVTLHTNQLQFIRELSDPFIDQLNLAYTKDYFSAPYIEKLVKHTHFTLSTNYILYILSFYLEDFFLLGNIADSLREDVNKKDRHIWSQLYLVKKEIEDAIDYLGFINDISLRLNEDIDESYSLCFIRHLRHYIINEAIYISHKEIIHSFVLYVLSSELNLYLDEEDKLVLKKNTAYTLRFVIPRVIEKVGKPITLKELHLIIRKEFPQVSSHPNSIRSTCISDPEIITFGRSSTYGLKKWESDETKNIQGGTIRDIVFEYLNEQDKPVHIFEIYQHVKKFRKDTYPRSISDNLRAQKEAMFLFYNQNYIGLEDKDYGDSNLLDLPRFLGKDILKLLRDNPYYSYSQVVSQLANEYKIPEQEIKYIILYLEEQNYLIIRKNTIETLD